LELRVTQTPVSHQVKALEDALGVTLLERLLRGLTLTDEGHALLL
jgi:LysR family transcriptional regulator of beta-lactamase